MDPAAAPCSPKFTATGATAVGFGEAFVGGLEQYVAFLELVNPLQQPQDVDVIYNFLDGRTIKQTYTVPGCGAYSAGIHALAGIGIPAQTLYLRAVAYFPGPGFAQMVIRSLPTFDSSPPILPPPAVLR